MFVYYGIRNIVLSVKCVSETNNPYILLGYRKQIHSSLWFVKILAFHKAIRIDGALIIRLFVTRGSLI